MADESSLESSNQNVDNCTHSWDSSVIIESAQSKSIVCDGTGVEWCKDFELLKDFIQSAFCIHGNGCRLEEALRNLMHQTPISISYGTKVNLIQLHLRGK